MDIFEEFLSSVDNKENREKMKTIFMWILKKFPNLSPRIAWNQPMFTDHGTFIIGFSTAKNHFAFAPETKCLNHFLDEIESAGYDYGKKLVRIKWTESINYELLEKIITFNIFDKSDCKTFWRK
ncbi:MAG TPA: DUF1801 domain-containing protein [Tepiditoga sp.]|nr:DUF1801 domain-containing protein [Thermotogota bacterium]HOO74746.1 DUF1801 domain-containing protein [Tepiditoga sp.]